MLRKSSLCTSRQLTPNLIIRSVPDRLLVTSIIYNHCLMMLCRCKLRDEKRFHLWCYHTIGHRLKVVLKKTLGKFPPHNAKNANWKKNENEWMYISITPTSLFNEMTSWPFQFSYDWLMMVSFSDSTVEYLSEISK